MITQSEVSLYFLITSAVLKEIKFVHIILVLSSDRTKGIGIYKRTYY